MDRFLAPLNDYHSIVCGPSSFGPVQVDSCILDTGCTTLLLPWPHNPEEVLRPLLSEPSLTCVTVLSGSVGSDHATFQVVAPNTAFRVVLEGHDLGISVSELRFVVTEEARRWLCAQDSDLWRGFCDAHVHNTNLEYALVGQAMLAQLLTLQIFNKGMLFVGSAAHPLPDESPSLAQLVREAGELYRAAVTSPYYERLRDLRDTERTNKAAHVRSPSSVGRRMQHFGVGVLS